MRSSFDLMSEVVAMSAMGFEEEFRTPGQPVIEPQRFAAALHLQLQDVARLAGVHCTTVAAAPANVKLQKFMREALRVMSATYQITGDRGRTFYWFRNQPIPEFERLLQRPKRRFKARFKDAPDDEQRPKPLLDVGWEAPAGQVSQDPTRVFGVLRQIKASLAGDSSESALECWHLRWILAVRGEIPAWDVDVETINFG